MLRLLTTAVLSLALVAAAPPPHKSTEKSCYVDGFETPVRCITITVPLDYENPNADTITVTVAIAPATTARPTPDPLFVFAGGPGQAATGMGPWLNSAFAPARRERDIVLFDIRGTGLSSAIKCEFGQSLETDAVESLRNDTAICAGKVGPAAAFYSSREVVEDIERMRAALGYQQINLWGGSFGTRVSQHYARAYASRVRAVILDAATSADSSIFATAHRYGQQALDLMLEDCVSDSSCASAFPNLKQDLDALFKRFATETKVIALADPRTGQMVKTMLNHNAMVGFVRGALYAGISRSMLPYAITQAAKFENYAPLAALGAMTGEWSFETMSLGSMMGILCGEDNVSAARLPATELSYGFMADSYVRMFASACSVWPHRPLPKAMFENFSARAPAMVISGARDPVTPPHSGEAMLRSFPNHTHVVITNGFHTNSASKCIAKLIGEFLKDPATGGRDHACTKAIMLPRFLTSPVL